MWCWEVVPEGLQDQMLLGKKDKRKRGMDKTKNEFTILGLSTMGQALCKAL